MSDAVNSAEQREEQRPSVHYDTRLPQLSRWRRAQIPLIASAVYWLMRTLGPTVRYEVLGWQHAQRIHDAGQPIIYTFWHRSMFSAIWWWRYRGVVAMNTTNFDGQWTRRVIERLGYGTAQGSSTRGGLKGLAVMAQRLAEGRDAAFAVDGPRGPRYVAKPGPVILARRTGFPIVVFHAGLDSAYTFEKSWDLLRVPYPFARGVILISAPIRVPADASRGLLHDKQAEVQAGLERVRDLAESWFTLSPEERERRRAAWNA